VELLCSLSAARTTLAMPRLGADLRNVSATVQFPSIASKRSQSIGGIANGIKLRTAALAAYNANPKHCLKCGAIIPVRDGEKVATVRRREFCNQRCAGSFNNESRKKSYACSCGASVSGPRRKCRKCANQREEKAITRSDKGRLFGSRKNWQSARSAIQQHARRVYKSSSEPKFCVICGYDTHFDVCHIKAVSEFGATSSVLLDVNALSNLVALCKNHHWEFDNEIIAAVEVMAARDAVRSVPVRAHNAGCDRIQLPTPLPNPETNAFANASGVPMNAMVGKIAFEATRPDQSSR
jgi:hypothetical protein